MAKRKQNPPPANIEAVRWGSVILIVLVISFLAFQAFSSFLRHAKLFLVKDISIAEELGDIDSSELAKMKGHNIFEVDLTRVEERLRAKYPRIGDLGVIKRLPDQILVTGFKRVPELVALVSGRSLVVSRDGFFMGSGGSETEGLARVKGLRVSKAAAGEPVDDEDFGFVLRVIGAVEGEKALTPLFRGIDVEDPTRIVGSFGAEKFSFDVLMDHDHIFEQTRKLAEIIGRTELDLSGIKYIDLRFGEPIIGRKKTARK